MERTRNELKSWFVTGAYPTQQQFADWLDSFLHKSDDPIAIESIQNLRVILNQKADQATYDALLKLYKDIFINALVKSTQFTGEVTGTYDAVKLNNSAVIGKTLEGLTVPGKPTMVSPQNSIAEGIANLQSQLLKMTPLDDKNMIPVKYLPAIAITDVNIVSSEVEMLALVAQRGDVAIRTDTNKTYMLAVDDPTKVANWKAITADGKETDPVFTASAAAKITASDITKWNVKPNLKAVILAGNDGKESLKLQELSLYDVDGIYKGKLSPDGRGIVISSESVDISLSADQSTFTVSDKTGKDILSIGQVFGEANIHVRSSVPLSAPPAQADGHLVTRGQLYNYAGVAGTAVLPIVQFKPGSLLTAPQRGAWEFDGKELFFTKNDKRQVVTLDGAKRNYVFTTYFNTSQEIILPTDYIVQGGNAFVDLNIGWAAYDNTCSCTVRLISNTYPKGFVIGKINIIDTTNAAGVLRINLKNSNLSSNRIYIKGDVYSINNAVGSTSPLPGWFNFEGADLKLSFEITGNLYIDGITSITY